MVRFQTQNTSLVHNLFGTPISEPVGTVQSAQSQKREVGIIALWYQVRMYPPRKMFLTSLFAMKAHCEAKHSVVIESVSHHATIWVCMLWCALRNVMGCASLMICGLSFLEMSRPCPCFHDCGIHTCPSFQIITNPLTTRDHILSPKHHLEAVNAW